MRLLISICLLCIGCRSFHAEFVEVVRDHEIICVETCQDLIASIDEKIEIESDPGRMQGLIDLKDRLNYLTRSSQVISDYVESTAVDEKLLKELIEARWH